MKRIVLFLLTSSACVGFAQQDQMNGQKQMMQQNMNGNGNTPPASPRPTSGIQWQTDYQKAVALAKQTRKPILLFFTGSDWCRWCQKMETEIFSSPEFISDVGQSFVFVEIDFPQNRQLPPQQQTQNRQLKEKFNVTGYPTVIILDSNENFLAEADAGYHSGGGKAYAIYLKEFIKQQPQS